MEVVELRPNGQTICADGGMCRDTNTGCDAVVIEETEPVSPNELSVGEQAPDWLVRAVRQEVRRAVCNVGEAAVGPGISSQKYRTGADLLLPATGFEE